MKDVNLTELNQKLVDWAKARNIIGDSTGLAQANKTIEEVHELHEALATDNRAEVIDAIGDIYVTLAIIADIEGLDIKDCVASAYDEIKDRKGKMINGLFVKEEDL